ncbi:hypothetical protein [Clostridium sp.]|jgi:hypothetical protein|nr:hypothetical protein [Clostridium sp.]MDF2503254.1 hypothetical protein [Clostridium sp.]
MKHEYLDRREAFLVEWKYFKRKRNYKIIGTKKFNEKWRIRLYEV